MAPTLSGEALRRFRHDLRTPLNHIIGFAEIMIDDAEDHGRPEPVAALRRIRAGGYDLLALLQREFAPEIQSMQQGDMKAAEQAIVPRLEEVLKDCAELEATGVFRDLPEDLDQLRTISAALRSMAEMLAAEVQNLA
jgi:signal transduction histidine kinase